MVQEAHEALYEMHQQQAQQAQQAQQQAQQAQQQAVANAGDTQVSLPPGHLDQINACLA